MLRINPAKMNYSGKYICEGLSLGHEGLITKELKLDIKSKFTFIISKINIFNYRYFSSKNCHFKYEWKNN